MCKEQHTHTHSTSVTMTEMPLKPVSFGWQMLRTYSAFFSSASTGNPGLKHIHSPAHTKHRMCRICLMHIDVSPCGDQKTFIIHIDINKVRKTTGPLMAAPFLHARELMGSIMNPKRSNLNTLAHNPCIRRTCYRPFRR